MRRRSTDLQLERLESAADGCTAGTLPPRPLLGHENLDARLAEPTDALGACV